MAAELNSYPGPKHVIELAEALQLGQEQSRQAQEIFDRMHARAIKLGSALVDTERDLDLLLADGRAKARTVKSLIAELGRIRSDLRFVHMRAHLEMREVLTDAQIATYDRLRGYHGAGDDGHDHRHGRHDVHPG